MASNLPTKNGEADRDNLQIDHALTDDALSSSLLSSLQATAKTEALKLNKIVNDSTVEQTADFITITSVCLLASTTNLTRGRGMPRVQTCGKRPLPGIC